MAIGGGVCRWLLIGFRPTRQKNVSSGESGLVFCQYAIPDFWKCALLRDTGQAWALGVNFGLDRGRCRLRTNLGDAEEFGEVVEVQGGGGAL